MRDSVATRKAGHTTSTVQPAINLHIEELVLHGFAPGEHHRIGEAVRCELTQLFSKRGPSALLTRSGDAERLDGGTFEMNTGMKPELIGAQVARRVHRLLAQ